MQERRRFVRLNIPLEVSYSISGKGDSAFRSVTKNISPNGARFALAEALPKGTILGIDIKIPARVEPISVKARIVWTKKEDIQGEDFYDAGFEFVQISDENKRVFFQYLCNLMYEQLGKFE